MKRWAIKILRAWSCLSTQPVSYTHLDVYKRQGEYWGGFTRHNTLFRRVLGMDGAELGEEFITENHAIMMYNPMLEETAP